MEELSDLEVAAIKETLNESLGLVDRLLIANRTAGSLEALRTHARTGKNYSLALEDGLLLY